MEQNELLGALIGLGRSAEGNKNRPDTATHQILLKGIRMLNDKSSFSNLQITEQIQLLHQEKYKLAPRCLTCAKQCGRNDDYRFDPNDPADHEMSSQQLSLLALLVSVGTQLVHISDEEELYRQAAEFLYDALFLLGSTSETDELLTCLNAGNRLLQELVDKIIL